VGTGALARSVERGSTAAAESATYLEEKVIDKNTTSVVRERRQVFDFSH
jgi:hypothetical protein